jgi:serine/threonine protein kinase
MRFRGHPNILSLYSYWSEPSTSSYVYKNLVLLEDEGVLGDLLNTVVLSSMRPTSKLALRYMSDVTKALTVLHQSGVIHGGVKPSCVFLSMNNAAILGELKKTELDSARATHQLFSRILIG